MSEAPISLLMDVDTGVDDCVALLLALSSARAELVAVTCCAGNVPASQAAANTLAVLELAGAGHVEVALGSLAPLLVPLRTATGHGPRGLGYAELPDANASLSPRFAPDLLVAEARRRPGELLLVATGPLTNVALAVRRDPELPRLLRRLVIMGGAFEHVGNTTPVAQFNVAVDPEASKLVLEAFSSAPIRPLICGLNVTEQAELSPEHLRRLAELAGSVPDEAPDLGDPPGTRSASSNSVVRCLSDALRFSMEAHVESGYGYVAQMHDPLAVALALDPSLGETRPGTVDVELQGSLTRGMTVVDWRGDWGRPHNAEVAVEVDVPRFRDELIERIAALARRVG
jgi:purine nucleosidase